MNGNLPLSPGASGAPVHVPYSPEQCIDLLAAPTTSGAQRAAALHDLMGWIDAGQVDVQDLPPAAQLDVGVANVWRVADAQDNWEADLSAVLDQMLQTNQQIRRTYMQGQALLSQQAANKQREQGEAIERSADDKLAASDAQAGSEIGAGAIQAGAAVGTGVANGKSNEAMQQKLDHQEQADAGALSPKDQKALAVHESEIEHCEGRIQEHEDARVEQHRLLKEELRDGKGTPGHADRVAQHREIIEGHDANIADYRQHISQRRSDIKGLAATSKQHWLDRAKDCDNDVTMHGHSADKWRAWGNAMDSWAKASGTSSAAQFNHSASLDDADQQYRGAEATAATEQSREAGELSQSSGDWIKGVLDLKATMESKRAEAMQRAANNVS